MNEKAVTASYWRVVDQLDSSEERSWRQQKMSSLGKSDTSVIRQGITSPWRTKHNVVCHQIGIAKIGLFYLVVDLSVQNRHLSRGLAIQRGFVRSSIGKAGVKKCDHKQPLQERRRQTRDEANGDVSM